jgi:hypothetical protein
VIVLEAGDYTAVTAEMDDAGWITLRAYTRGLASRRWCAGPAFAVERVRVDWTADAIARAVDRLAPRSGREAVLRAIERAALAPCGAGTCVRRGVALTGGSEAGSRPHGAA